MGFVKATLLIVLQTLHHFLHLSALSLLLFYLVKALVHSPSHPFAQYTLGNLFLLYWSHDFKYLGSQSYPTLDPSLAPPVCRDVLLRLSVVALCVSVTFLVSEAYTSAETVKICRHFGIFFVFGLVAATIYTSLTVSRSTVSGETIKERRMWVNGMTRWSIQMVRASRWIVGGAWFLSFVDFMFPFVALCGLPSGIWRWASAGASVGMLPLVFLCAISTQAALYVACTAHRQQSKLDCLISSSEPPSSHGYGAVVRAQSCPS